MQIEGEAIKRGHFSASLIEKAKDIRTLKGSNLLGVASEKRLLIHRVDPGALGKFFEFEDRGTSNTDSIADFVISPAADQVFISFEKGRAFCVDTEETDPEKRQIQIFQTATAGCSQSFWTELNHEFGGSFDCFRPVGSARVAKNVKNYLHEYIKPSFSHVFADKNNLLRIQNLEDLAERRGKMNVLTAVESGEKLRGCFNGILEFMEIELSKLIPVKKVESLKYFWLNDFKTLGFLWREKRDSNQWVLVGCKADVSAFESHLREVFLVAWMLANLKESDSNLKLGVFKSRTTLKTHKDALKNWFPEAIRDDPELASSLCEFAVTGKTEKKALVTFLKELELKKMLGLAENIGKFLKSLFEFFLECVISQYQRMAIFIRDLRQINEFMSVKKAVFLPEKELKELELLVQSEMETAQRIVSKIVRKKLELRNFFLFCFKARFQLSGKAKDSNEYQNLHESIVDYPLLIEFLKKKESLFLDDFNGEFNNVALSAKNPIKPFDLLLESGMEQSLAVLANELEVNSGMTAEESNVPITAGFFQIMNEISSKLKTVTAVFTSRSLLVSGKQACVDFCSLSRDRCEFGAEPAGKSIVNIVRSEKDTVLLARADFERMTFVPVAQISVSNMFSGHFNTFVNSQTQVLIFGQSSDSGFVRVKLAELSKKTQGKELEINFDKNFAFPDLLGIAWNFSTIVVAFSQMTIQVLELPFA